MIVLLLALSVVTAVILAESATNQELQQIRQSKERSFVTIFYRVHGNDILLDDETVFVSAGQSKDNLAFIFEQVNFLMSSPAQALLHGEAHIYVNGQSVTHHAVETRIKGGDTIDFVLEPRRWRCCSRAGAELPAESAALLSEGGLDGCWIESE